MWVAWHVNFLKDISLLVLLCFDFDFVKYNALLINICYIVQSAKFKSLLTSMKGLQNQLDMSLKEVEVLKESRERQMNMVCIKDIYYCISRSWCTISQLYRQHY